MKNWKCAGVGFWGILFVIGIETGTAFNYFDEPNNISADAGVGSFNERCSELLLDFFTEYFSILLAASASDDRSLDGGIEYIPKVNERNFDGEYIPNVNIDDGIKYIPRGNNSSKSNSSHAGGNRARAREFISELLLSLDPPLASIALQYLDNRNDSALPQKNQNLSSIVREAVAKIFTDRNGSHDAYVLTARRTFDDVLRTKRETHLLLGYLLGLFEEVATELRRAADTELNRELLQTLGQRLKRQTSSFVLNTTGQIKTPDADSLLKLPERVQQLLVSKGFDARSSLGDMVHFVVQIFTTLFDRMWFEVPAAGINRLHTDKLFERLLPNLAILAAASPRQNEFNPSASIGQVQNLISQGKGGYAGELNALWDGLLKPGNDTRVLRRVKRVDNPPKNASFASANLVAPAVAGKTSEKTGSRKAPQKNISKRQIPLIYKPVPIISTVSISSASAKNLSDTSAEKLQTDANQNKITTSPPPSGSTGSIRVNVSEIQGKNITVSLPPQMISTQGVSVVPNSVASSNQTVKLAAESPAVKSTNDSGRISMATIPNDLVKVTHFAAGVTQASTGLPASTQASPAANVSEAAKVSTTVATTAAPTTTPPAKSSSGAAEPSKPPSPSVPAKTEPATNDSTKLPVSSNPVEPSSTLVPTSTKTSEPSASSKSSGPSNAVSESPKIPVPINPVPAASPPEKSAASSSIPPISTSNQPPIPLISEPQKSVALLNTSVQPVSIMDPLNDSAKTANSSASSGAPVKAATNTIQNSVKPLVMSGSAATGPQNIPPSIAIQYLNSGVGFGAKNETKAPVGGAATNVPPVPSNASGANLNASLPLTNLTGFMKEMAANQGQATEQVTERSKLSDANILGRSDYFNRDSVKFSGDIRTGSIQQYAGLMVVLVVLSLIVIGSVLFWKFSSETGTSGNENTTTRENPGSMNNYCYLSGNSNSCARTSARAPDRGNSDDERNERSQLIELTQFRKTEVSA